MTAASASDRLTLNRYDAAVGYGTPQSFARAFMEKRGLTPTQWLERASAADV